MSETHVAGIDRPTALPARLASIRRLVAVTAHPDDESFGLGGVLAAFAAAGTQLGILCFTHGEESTLGRGQTDLAEWRAHELAAAAQTLDIDDVTLLQYQDGALATVPLGELAAHVLGAAAGADALLAFDEEGITGHPDHRRATEAAMAAARELGIPVLAWTIPARVATVLNAEYGTCFVGRDEGDIDCAVTIDRSLQIAAISCHRSQSEDNPIVWRRLALQGETEWLRIISPRSDDDADRP